MKSKKPKKRLSTPAPSGKGKTSADRRLVVIDQEPIRRKAASDCSREMEKLELLREEWRRFEEEDGPGFQSWMAATFGALLTTLRTNEAVIQSKTAIIDEVELAMMFGEFRSYRAAYAAVMKDFSEREARSNSQNGQRRGAGDDEEFPGDDEDYEDDGGMAGDNGRKSRRFDDEIAEDIAEAEREVFDRYLKSLNLDKRTMSQATYDELFADYKAGFSDPFMGNDEPRDRKSKGGTKAEQKRALAALEKQKRVKELYRILVRRLHPDLRADGDPRVSALWHEVQEAYAAENIERLEMLLALTDMQSDGISGQATISQMRSALLEMRRAFQALKSRLAEVRSNPAWNFSRIQDHSALKKRIQRELADDLAQQTLALREIESLLEQWSKPRPPKKKAPKKAPKPAGKPKARSAFQRSQEETAARKAAERTPQQEFGF